MRFRVSPVHISKGIFFIPRTRIIQLQIWLVIFITHGQYLLGTLMLIRIALTTLRRKQFRHSATPFYGGLYDFINSNSNPYNFAHGFRALNSFALSVHINNSELPVSYSILIAHLSKISRIVSIFLFFII